MIGGKELIIGLIPFVVAVAIAAAIAYVGHRIVNDSTVQAVQKVQKAERKMQHIKKQLRHRGF